MIFNLICAIQLHLKLILCNGGIHPTGKHLYMMQSMETTLAIFIMDITTKMMYVPWKKYTPMVSVNYCSGFERLSLLQVIGICKCNQRV